MKLTNKIMTSLFVAVFAFGLAAPAVWAATPEHNSAEQAKLPACCAAEDGNCTESECLVVAKASSDESSAPATAAKIAKSDTKQEKQAVNEEKSANHSFHLDFSTP